MKRIAFLFFLISTFSLYSQSDGKKWIALSENFDGDFLPSGWTSVVNNENGTWTSGEAYIDFSTIDDDNVLSAVVNPVSAGVTQDEWLISPEIVVPENAILSFYALYSWDYLPAGNEGNPGATMQLKVSVEGQDWSTLWDANNTPQFDGYEWKNRLVDLYSYSNQSVQFAWVISGLDGGFFALDGVEISVSLDNDIAIVPTLPFGGAFNFVQIPFSQIDELNDKLGEYFSQITPDLSFYQCKIKNNGYNTATNAIFKVFVNNEQIGQTDPIDVAPDTESEIVGIPSLLDFQLGENIVAFEVDMDEDDDYPADNFASQKKILTEDLYAVDSVKFFESGLSDYNSAANLFAISSNQYVLNGVALAFDENCSANPYKRAKISLYFYQTADNIFYDTEPVLGQPFFVYEIEDLSSMVGAFGELIIPYLRFPQFGTYLLVVETVGDDSLGLCYDNTDVNFYTIENNQVVAHSGYGAVAARMVINDIPSSSCNATLSDFYATDNCDGTVDFTWNGNADGYIFNLQYTDSQGQLVNVDMLTADNKVVLNSLERGFNYKWTVTPYNEDGVCGSSYGNNWFLYMDSFEPISELNYEVNYDAVTLFWNAPDAEGITAFDVYKNGSMLLSTDQTSVTIVSDNSVSNYGVKVKYYDQCYSDLFEIVVDAICDMPSDISADNSEPNSVYLQWSEAADGASYFVYRDGSLLTEMPIQQTYYNDTEVESGDYYYSVTAYYQGNDCESEAIDCSVNVFDGIGAFDLSAKLYPNPADDYFVVEGDGLDKVVIYNVLGKIVKSIDNLNASSVKVNVSDLSKGVYIVNVYNIAGNVDVNKVIIR